MTEDPFYSYGVQIAPPSDMQLDYGVYDTTTPVVFPEPEEDKLESKPPLYAFQVVDDGDGTVSVTEGTVNTETATGLTPTGKPDELWLEVTFSATTGEVTAAAIETASSAVSETNDSRQIATITWGGTGSNTPTIVQGIKGSQSITSCGATHQWGTLYS